MRPGRQSSCLRPGQMVVMSRKLRVGRLKRHTSAMAEEMRSASLRRDEIWSFPAPITALNMFLTDPLQTSEGWGCALPRLLTRQSNRF